MTKNYSMNEPGGNVDSDKMLDGQQIHDVYIYSWPKAQDGAIIGKPNTHVIISFSQDVEADWKSNVIEGVLAYNTGGFVRKATSGKTDNQKYRIEKTLYLLTEDYKNKVDSTMPYIATIGAPLDVAKADAGDQIVYQVSNIKSGNYETPEDVEGISNAYDLSTLQLININKLDESFPNYSISFNDNPNYNNGKITSIEIQQNPSLIGIPDIRGKDFSGKTVALESSLKGNLFPILMNITEDTDKLTLYSPWLDHDFALPMLNAASFIQPSKLDAILKTENQRKLILDLLIITYGYSTRWNFVEYVNDGTDAGKVKGDQYVGFSAIQVSAITDANPQEITDAIFEKYKAENPLDIGTDTLLEIQQFISGLSKWIQSSYAIAGGFNDFNKIYYPFTLNLFTQMIPKLVVDAGIPYPTADAVDSWVLDENVLTFITKSEYFTFIPADANNEFQISYSGEIKTGTRKLIQTDRKLTLPILPSVVEALDKLPLPNDISIDTAQDIQYLLYAPIPQDKIKSFLGDSYQLDVSLPPNSDINIPETALSNVGKQYEDTQEGKEQLFTDLGYRGTFVSGELQIIDSEEEITLTYSQTRDRGTNTSRFSVNGQEVINENGLWPNDLSLGGEALTLYAYELFRPEYKDIVYSISPTTFTPNYSYNELGQASTSPLFQSRQTTVFTKRYRLINLNYKTGDVGGSITESLYSRQAIFDKQTWSKFLELFAEVPRTTRVSYTLEIDEASQGEAGQENTISEIIWRSLWTDEIVIIINGVEKVIKTFANVDETIATEHIIML